MTHRFVHVIFIIIFYSYLKWIYFKHIFKSYLGYPRQFVINNGCYMDENLQWKNDVILLLPHHHLIIKCTINIWLQLFDIGFEVISCNYKQLCSRLGHLIIDFLVSNDRIPFNDSHTFVFFPFFSFFKKII